MAAPPSLSLSEGLFLLKDISSSPQSPSEDCQIVELLFLGSLAYQIKSVDITVVVNRQSIKLKLKCTYAVLCSLIFWCVQCSLMLMYGCVGMSTDRRPCALSSRLVRSLSRSSTSRNRKKTSLHSGWVSNNLFTMTTTSTSSHP